MNFDINAAQANLDRWDLDLTIDGETHPVREVTLQEFADLVNREALTPDEQLDTLAGLFHKTAPPVRDWSRDKRDVVFTAIGAYLNEHLEKKRHKVRTMIRAAINMPGVTARAAGAST